jgi:L-threonylcarbamoyladenylate synthase
MAGITSSNIEKAASLLKEGKVVAIPTETVYGLAANMWDEDAILRVFATKKRPLTNPLIVHIGHVSQLELLVEEVPYVINKLITHFWPGPLTILLPKNNSISHTITAGSPFVAVRMPKHDITLKLIEKTGFPLVAPSANPANQVSPTSAEHVEKYFGQSIDMILDGGICEKGIESTIVSWNGEKIVIHREGSLSREVIHEALGSDCTISKDSKEITAPGQFSKHYAPSKPLYLCNNIDDHLDDFKGMKVGIITYNEIPKNKDVCFVRILAPNNSLTIAMKNLYRTLHEMEDLPIDCILCEWMPNEKEGKGINDRLRRAATKILSQ